MQAIGRQPQRAPDGAPVHYDRHRPEQTTLYRLVQQHAATFFAQAEDAAVHLRQAHAAIESNRTIGKIVLAGW